MADRPTVVLLPGLGYGRSLWATQVEQLSPWCDPVVVVPDSEDMGAVLDQILAAGGERFVLVAHSAATLAGFACAAQSPDRVSALINMGSMAEPLPPIAEYMKTLIEQVEAGDIDSARAGLRSQALGGGHHNEPELEAAVLRSQEEVPQDVFVAQCRFLIANMDQQQALSRIQVPTLLLHASDDGFFDLASAQRFQHQITDARLSVVHGSGHLVMVERPAAVTALIQAWGDLS
ncbi:MAG: alpha/beta hydrolase [Actinobacteria bacterium]|nr:alpha/beta hydrolase [Actinomycetota bacterium]